MTKLGALPPSIRTKTPGPLGERLIDLLARAECPALTSRRARRSERAGAPQDPIVWREAAGANVVDVDGNVYVDFTSGFGVAALGHRPEAVVAAVHEQADRLLHALGDVHPSDVKIELLEALAAFSGIEGARIILGSHGGDAIEAALKTAALHTGRPGVLAFEGGYHGLSHGPLAILGYQPAFRAPFAAQLNPHVVFAPYPREDATLEEAMAGVHRALEEARARGVELGAVVIEPMLGRGGMREPPREFLPALRALTTELGALLIVDEIFTGLHRAGPRLLSRARGVEADILCLGKSLGGGMPISAAIAGEAIMRSWGAPGGEAIHTATFLGHPLACAGALATLRSLDDGIEARVERVGAAFTAKLRATIGASRVVREIRGPGLAIGVELDRGERTLRVIRRLLERGYLVIPAGNDASVLQLTPPLVIEEALLDGLVDTLADVLREEEARA